MIPDQLSPDLELLSQEYVLVQAWKKTASYIRYHNWYSDTLALDLAAVDLPRFLGDLAERLKSPEDWINDPLRVVPAPKCQEWHVSKASGWSPRNAKAASKKLRPLAHVSLKDQVAATALMLCVADRVETLQGDTRRSTEPLQRKRVVSYGNRLFCDSSGGTMRHRWGSGKLYRAYFQDYRTFLSRTAIVGDAALKKTDGERVVVVCSDLRQFFDRVRPSLLMTSLKKRQRPNDDERFYKLARRILHWKWDPRDEVEISDYRRNAELSEIDSVALPQGLVASGFFSNVALLDFDDRLRAAIGEEWVDGIHLEDASRYVDDLRLVLLVKNDTSLERIEHEAKQWLQNLLNDTASGLRVSEEKTNAAAFRGDERALVRQSRKMARIQAAVSGGFDAVGGEEILEAVQGLIRSQRRFSESRKTDEGWMLSPVPDVRDPTVARFAAGRFRTTFRSLRPLLPDGKYTVASTEGEELAGGVERPRISRTKAALDDDARAFALGLIEQWIEDPSNVRLLRIGLDIWPAGDVIKSVFALLRPYTESVRGRRAPRRVAWYCLSEIFRAAATETGIVEDAESLPEGLSVLEYRKVLCEEAVRLSKLSRKSLPWYLKQQVLLFLAASGCGDVDASKFDRSPETKHYRQLLRFLKNETGNFSESHIATFAILGRRAFLDRAAALQVTQGPITSPVFNRIAEQDPSFALEIHAGGLQQANRLSSRLQLDLCLGSKATEKGWKRLSAIVLDGGVTGPLRNELAIAQFASSLLDALQSGDVPEALTPSEVLIKLSAEPEQKNIIDGLKIVQSSVHAEGSIYLPPIWCPPKERWRFQLGFLLRFILTGRGDFTRSVRPDSWREKAGVYRAPESHWLHRVYALYNAQIGFGDDWLPISDWTEQLLSALLRWPGCQARDLVEVVNKGLPATKTRIDLHVSDILGSQGPSATVLMLPVRAPWPVKPSTARPLRACVVQTVIPGPRDFSPGDLTLSAPAMRRRHRNHLSAALAAVERMLALRETHKGQDSRLDLLILPELAVHPADVKSHLIPFARTHKTIILAGLVYEQLIAGEPLVNSALWVIPQWSKARGLQMITRRQGKQNLAALELKLNEPTIQLQGFRPCQWLVGYEWSGSKKQRALWLTASVCYDATDLQLAADLRRASDVFAIPALNQDVTTFDQMALALHYHMFQMVVVANNGLFGGSNAYAPYRDAFNRQVFHLRGQPQASIAFLEIDDIGAFLTRRSDALTQSEEKLRKGKTPSEVKRTYAWKYPPAE
jgi:hypothetical protein